jgi:hypothetical protein
MEHLLRLSKFYLWNHSSDYMLSDVSTVGYVYYQEKGNDKVTAPTVA